MGGINKTYKTNELKTMLVLITSIMPVLQDEFQVAGKALEYHPGPFLEASGAPELHLPREMGWRAVTV